MSDIEKKPDCIIQDGVKCPAHPPWPKRVSIISGIPLVLFVAMGAVVLWETNLLKFIVFVLAVIGFLVPLRYLICARCPYYGEYCSTTMGKIVPLFFKKQEGKSMVLGLWLDVVFAGFLLVYPLPDMWAYGGWTALALWLLLFLLVFMTLTKLACSLCPFTFCPIGKAGRGFWGFLEGGES